MEAGHVVSPSMENLHETNFTMMYKSSSRKVTHAQNTLIIQEHLNSFSFLE